MKINKIRTTRFKEFENLIWVEIFSDQGPVGLGETYFNPTAVESLIHEYIAPKILGEDPLRIDFISRNLVGYLGFRGSGAETRARSAIDLALWDLFGKAVNQPVYQLLGGKCRDQVPTYNTCAGTHYVRTGKQQASDNWGLNQDRGSRFDDLNGFLERADDLAEDLLSDGIGAMKIWPFDTFAEKNNGYSISFADLKKGLEPFKKIRKRVGDKIEIMVEFHSMWKLNPAIRIAEHLAEFETFWHEDPIKMDVLANLKKYALRSKAPVCASETLAGAAGYRDLLDLGVAGVIMPDLSWCGGMTEAKRIAGMAEVESLPVAPHDCTGPVVFTASTHLSLNAPNAIYQESVRAFYKTWYRDLLENGADVNQGFVSVSGLPGWGVNVNPELDKQFNVFRKESGL